MAYDARAFRVSAGGALSVCCALIMYGTARSFVGADQGVLLIFWTTIPFVVATAGFVTGITVALSDLERSHALLAVGWPFAGMLFTGILSVLTVVFEVFHGVQFARVSTVLLNNLTGGLAGGLLVGGFHVRSTRRTATIERQRDELKLLNRIVRHDISNNLTVALGMTDHIESYVPDEDGESHDRLRRSLQNAVTLTENALVAIRVFEEEGELGREPVDLQPIVREQIESLRATYPRATVRSEDVPDVTVRGHELLSTVFRNLLTNAVRHNPAADPTVEVKFEETDTTVRISVADDGPGVSDELKAAVVETGAGTLDRDVIGIGLSIVSAVIHACGGDLRVGTSDLGGARFTVSLSKQSVDPF